MQSFQSRKPTWTVFGAVLPVEQAAVLFIAIPLLLLCFCLCFGLGLCLARWRHKRQRRAAKQKALEDDAAAARARADADRAAGLALAPVVPGAESAAAMAAQERPGVVPGYVFPLPGSGNDGDDGAARPTRPALVRVDLHNIDGQSGMWRVIEFWTGVPGA